MKRNRRVISVVASIVSMSGIFGSLNNNYVLGMDIPSENRSVNFKGDGFYKKAAENFRRGLARKLPNIFLNIVVDKIENDVVYFSYKSPPLLGSMLTFNLDGWNGACRLDRLEDLNSVFDDLFNKFIAHFARVQASFFPTRNMSDLFDKWIDEGEYENEMFDAKDAYVRAFCYHVRKEIEEFQKKIQKKEVE